MVEPSPQGAVQNLLNYIGQDFTHLDPVQIETMLSMEGESPVLINDEISAFPPDQMDQRRGTTTDHLVIHIAGAAAQSGMNIDDLVKLLEKAIFNSRSLGVSTSECA